MDALLGAAALGDIGRHFPDSDNQYKDISSMKLLYEVLCLLKKEKYSIINIDATVIAQKPKLAKYMQAMEQNIANILEIDKHSVNVKATTEEGLGFTGAELGIAAKAVCLIEKIEIEKSIDGKSSF